MRTAAVLALALFVTGCGSLSPVPVKTGQACAECGKPITEVRLAAEAISPSGAVSVFRSPECLARYVRAHPAEVGAKYVTDYATSRMVRPESATYVRAVVDEETGERAYVAFAKVQDAVEFGKDRYSSPVDWLMIQRMSAERKSD